MLPVRGASRGGGDPLVRDGARVRVPAPVEGERLQRKPTVTDEEAQPVPRLLRVPPHGQDVKVERDQAPDERDGRQCGDVVGRQRGAVRSLELPPSLPQSLRTRDRENFGQLGASKVEGSSSGPATRR